MEDEFTWIEDFHRFIYPEKSYEALVHNAFCCAKSETRVFAEVKFMLLSDFCTKMNLNDNNGIYMLSWSI